MVIGDDDLSEIKKCEKELVEENAEYDYTIPHFKAGSLYYMITGRTSHFVEVRSSICGCREDANYSQLDTCIVPEKVIYKGITYTVRGIGYGVFSNCPRLKKVVLPNTIRYIAPGNFWDCDSIMSLNIPTNLKRVGKGAWDMNPYMQEWYKQLPDSIERVNYEPASPY